MISSKIKKDEEEGGVAGEWKYAAMVMDRFDDSYSNYSYAFNFYKKLRCTLPAV